MFYYLIYLSDSSNSNSHHIIQNILDNVADWNKELDISGFLVYRDGNFLQLLEGNKNEVLTLFTKIKKDQRHKNVTLILEDESENRIFSDYESGFLVPKNKLVLDKLNNYLFNLKLLENPKINSTISILENILAKMY
ncbi:BLUF domain-containing protein [Leeuwenhoekiella sp. UBA6783]|nr:BLUF domain-containing protein [Leeuwenhoekiella sp. UBA6783]